MGRPIVEEVAGKERLWRVVMDTEVDRMDMYELLKELRMGYLKFILTAHIEKKKGKKIKELPIL